MTTNTESPRVVFTTAPCLPVRKPEMVAAIAAFQVVIEALPPNKSKKLSEAIGELGNFLCRAKAAAYESQATVCHSFEFTEEELREVRHALDSDARVLPADRELTLDRILTKLLNYGSMEEILDRCAAWEHERIQSASVVAGGSLGGR